MRRKNFGFGIGFGDVDVGLLQKGNTDIRASAAKSIIAKATSDDETEGCGIKNVAVLTPANAKIRP